MSENNTPPTNFEEAFDLDPAHLEAAARPDIKEETRMSWSKSVLTNVLLTKDVAVQTLLSSSDILLAMASCLMQGSQTTALRRNQSEWGATMKLKMVAAGSVVRLLLCLTSRV